MAVTLFEELNRVAYEDGRSFGVVGPYERIDAIVHYAVDPDLDSNKGIVDLNLVERDCNGLVAFSGDVTLLRPYELNQGNHALLMQVPNRGARSLVRINLAISPDTPTTDVDPGDGYLFDCGWTIAWAGWQWDVPRTAARTRIGLTAPKIPPNLLTPASQMQLRIQPDIEQLSFILTDSHVGDFGNHQSISVWDVNDPDAKLMVRDTPYGSPTLIPRAKWRFAMNVNGMPVEDCGHVWLEDGFQAGLIYDLFYTPLDCPVVGVGLLATRDLASFLRYNELSPVAKHIRHAVGEGQSQCGRFLRTFLHLGLNSDEDEKPVFDGILAHIAGGRRGEFNNRYGQPSVQPTPSFGHLFPFSDIAQRDPYTGSFSGLLDTQKVRGCLPKIFYTDTSSEYWRGDANLTHTDLSLDADSILPDYVRRYLFASSQHGPGFLPLENSTVFGSIGTNYMNVIDYRPLYRAALANLLAWIVDEVEPPRSMYPRADNKTRRRRVDLIQQLSLIPGLSVPSAELLTTMYYITLGSKAADGVGEMPAVITNSAYPDWVSEVDEDGNEIAGIRMPDVSIPVATHTGFNPRHSDTGGTGQLLEYVGSTVPFSRNLREKEIKGDPRRSMEERYSSRQSYLKLVRACADSLVEQNLLLERDMDFCIKLAAERYDACIANPT